MALRELQADRKAEGDAGEAEVRMKREAIWLVTVALLTLASFALAEPRSASVWDALDILDRRVAGLLRIGLVHEVDQANALLQVSLGKGTDGSDFLTGWLPWPIYLRAEGMAPEKGQPVLLACPSGRLELAVVVALLPYPGEARER